MSNTNIGYISNMIVIQGKGLIMVKGDMTEAYDLIFNLTTCVELILTAGLECSHNQVYAPPQIPSGANLTCLNKKYSSTEVAH